MRPENTGRAKNDACSNNAQGGMMPSAEAGAAGSLSIVKFFYEPALFDFAQQAVVNKGFGIGGLSLRIVFLDKTEDGFDAAQRRVGNRLVVFGRQ